MAERGCASRAARDQLATLALTDLPADQWKACRALDILHGAPWLQTDEWHGMQRISSKATFFHKRILPVLMLGFVLLFMTISFGAAWRTGNGPPLPFFLAPIFIGVVMIFVFKKLVFDLVDEVWDAGDGLIVRNKGQEERIALSEIMNVNYSPFVNPPRVTLSLRSPSVFGDQISFCAPVRFVPFSTSPIIDELIKRVDAARRTAR
jgi:hypothetical protein